MAAAMARGCGSFRRGEQCTRVDLWLRVEEMMELLVVGSFFGMSDGFGACVRSF